MSYSRVFPAAFLVLSVAVCMPVRGQDPQPTGFDATPYAIAFFDSTTGIRVGEQTGFFEYGAIEITRDGGATWQQAGDRGSYLLRDITISGDSTAVAVGGTSSRTLLRTTDRGETWEQPTMEGSSWGELFGVTFATEQVAVAVGSGSIWRSEDAGATWKQVTLSSSISPYDVGFFDAENGIAVGCPGGTYLLLTTDGGQTWSQKQALSGVCRYRLHILGSDTVLLAGGDGIHRSTNRGGSWTPAMGDPVVNGWVSRSLMFLDASRGIAVGAGDDPCGCVNGTIHVTVDGGASWYAPTGVDFDLGYWAVAAPDQESVVIMGVGAEGEFSLRMAFADLATVTEKQSEPESLPRAFELAQNFPNPFNPVTTITYTIPFDSDVDLVVSDLLGRRVRVVNSGRQAGGVHQIVFDATGIPSGAHFYTLTAGAYTETKTMLLLR